MANTDAQKKEKTLLEKIEEFQELSRKRESLFDEIKDLVDDGFYVKTEGRIFNIMLFTGDIEEIQIKEL